MDAPAVSLVRKIAAMALAFALTLSMAPAAWADDAPAGTLAGAMAGNATEAPDDGADSGAAAASDDGQAPEADLQSADTAAADGGSGGTTISIAVYRSSFPIVKWDLNDDDFGLTKAEWAWETRTGELPKDASPGSEVAWPESGKPADYTEPARAGFEFAGWSTDRSASAGGFIDGSSPKLTMPEGAPESKDYTLYALWTPVEYSVIFDLAKNPEDGNGPGSDASFALNWESDSGVNRTVTDLGDGRFRVDGFTMDERTYDATTRTVGLPEPSRTGYRFLGWSEPDGQRLAIDNAAKDGYALNPVRLTQIDGTPVLTARWTSAFGVTAPLSVTFGDYDKTGAPGNPWLGDANASAGDDTTQSEADDTTKDEQSGYEALGQAYFENTGWHEAVKVVGLSSERHANANQVLTTYDSKQASEAAVLGDGTEANPGERLLSLYPSASAPVDKSSGVHFRLSDSLDEAALGTSFTMGAQGSGSEKLPITYGLNLSTDPSDGSANHGLVLPTNDYERKQIATVSYTFATATAANTNPYSHCSSTGSTNDDIYIEYDGKVYGTTDILHAAECISELGEASPCYALYDNIMHAQGVATNGVLPSNAGAKIYARYTGPEATATQPNSNRQGFVRLLLVGLNHDVLSLKEGSPDASGFAGDGSKDATNGTPYVLRRAGFTFQFADVLFAAPMSSANNVNGGWSATSLRNTTLAENGAIYNNIAIHDSIKSVLKFSNNRGAVSMNWDQVITTTSDKLFVGSYREILGGYYGSTSMHDGGPSSWLNHDGYHYEYYNDVCKAAHHPMNEPTVTRNLGSICKGMALSDATAARAWWLRTPNTPGAVDHTFITIGNSTGDDVLANSGEGNHTLRGVVPCFCL